MMIPRNNDLRIWMLSVLFMTLVNLNVSSQNYREVFRSKFNISIDSAKAFGELLIQSDQSHQRVFGFVTKGFYDQGFEELNKIENELLRSEEKARALYYYSLHFLMQHELEKARPLINEAIQLSDYLGDLEMKVKCIGLLARNYTLAGMYKEALENDKEIIALTKQQEVKLSSEIYLDELLRVHLNAVNTTLAFVLYEPMKNKSYIDSSAHFLNEVENVITKYSYTPSLTRERQYLHLKADYHYIQQEYEKAIELYTKSRELSEKLNAKKRIYQVNFRLGEIYFFKGEYEKAKGIFDELSRADLKKYKLLKNNAEIQYYYAEIYSKLGQNDKAMQYTGAFHEEVAAYYKTMNSARISVFTERSFQGKKKILDALELQDQRNKNLNLYIITVIVLALAAIFGFYLYSKRRQQRLEKKIESLLLDMAKTKDKTAVNLKIDEPKVKAILDKIKKVEAQELFLSKNYTLNTIAKKVGSNSTYVSKIINTYLNKSFIEYTNELRINYILVKLKEDKTYQRFTLNAIAESVGYKSVNSFNKDYKSIMGVTPKQYLAFLAKNPDFRV